jgi:GDSL-like Lipase/Acylhydrolase family
MDDLKKMKVFLVFVLLSVLTGCAAQEIVESPAVTVQATELPLIATIAPSETAVPTSTDPAVLKTRAPTPIETEPLPTAAPKRWQDWPVVPEGVSATTVEIYQRGLAMGNDPHAFSKIGDCETHTTWFLYDFDQGSNAYNLGPYDDLQNPINQFSGSFERLSVATKQGFTAASIMTTLWADPEKCVLGDTPLSCELRLHNPAFAIIALGTNDSVHPERFEENYRKVIEECIADGVVPILATKADNLEGDGSINATIVRIAEEYDVPLWNFWAALQDLPKQGMQDDGAHLTWYPNDFSDPRALEEASWPRRNFTALQVLDAVWLGVTQ